MVTTNESFIEQLGYVVKGLYNLGAFYDVLNQCLVEIKVNKNNPDKGKVSNKSKKMNKL